MSINPYDLLGVTIQTPLKDVKKAYYELSLLVHPDKGGSVEDMIAVHKAYKFVTRELSCINHSITIEELEREFQEFCRIQTEGVPMFQDIYAEAFDLKKFNEYFNTSSNVWKPFFEDGYSSWMEKSCIGMQYSAEEIGTLTHSFKDVEVYKEPEEYIVSCLENVDFTCMEKKEDFTCIPAYDYKEAFTTRNMTDNNDNTSPVKTIEDLEKERTAIDNITPTKDILWSSFGLYMEDGQKVRSFLQIK